MPFIAHTPEALLERKDSRNVLSTCRGLTTTGRHCRRPLGHSFRSPEYDGHVKVSRVQDSNINDPAAYCWQHQEQALSHKSNVVSSHAKAAARTSMDTLVERLALIDVDANRPHSTSNPKRTHRGASRYQKSFVTQQRPGFWRSLCCLDASVVDTEPAAEIRDAPLLRSLKACVPRLNSVGSDNIQHLLQTECAKPPSANDRPGYIYMFWLTDTDSRPTDDDAASLIDGAGRQLFPTFASTKKVLLKIGRAENVQRRLNQWTRQCGKNVSLIRYYPCDSVNKKDKVPNVRQVERLIHLELSQYCTPQACDACGKKHREWFTIDATIDDVRCIDRVVRRWIDWSFQRERS